MTKQPRRGTARFAAYLGILPVTSDVASQIMCVGPSPIGGGIPPRGGESVPQRRRPPLDESTEAERAAAEKATAR
jgi:hypothetical protein